MRLLGYGRVSQDDQESSLPNQRALVGDFCDSTDDNEYGERHHLVGWYEDENVSGSIYPAERPGFSELIDHLNEDESIEGIVVKNFKRLGRDVIDQITIQRFLERLHVGREIEVMCIDPWEGERRSLMDPRVQKMKDSDDPLAEWNKALVFVVNGLADGRDILSASVGSEKVARQRRKSGGAWGNNPRGLVTPKVAFVESTDTTKYVPVELAEDEAIADWEGKNEKSWDEEMTPLADVIHVLNLFASADTDPYEARVPPTAGGVGKEIGWSSPTRAVQNVWDRRNDYRQIGLEYQDELGFQIDF